MVALWPMYAVPRARRISEDLDDGLTVDSAALDYVHRLGKRLEGMDEVVV